MPPKVTLDVSGRYTTLRHGKHKPVRVVLHSTETPDTGVGGMLAICDYWRDETVGYGAHLIIGGDGATLRVVPDLNMAWHTGGANTGSLGIEQVGYARFTTARWYARPRQIMAVARWLAYWSTVYGIPLEASVAAGVSTHAMQSKIHPQSQGHTDPGKGYPLAFVLKLARTYKRYRKW